MKKQTIIRGVESRKKLMDGINLLADSVTCTLGPSGRNVIFDSNGSISSTKDGVSVAKLFQPQYFYLFLDIHVLHMFHQNLQLFP